MSRVLIVEDDVHIRRVLRTLLEGEGHAVSEAQDGLQGLAAALEGSPRCIISDTMMPQMDGLTMLEHLREQGREIPVILISAAHDLPDAARRESLGIVALFPKPFDFDALLKAVGDICANPGGLAPPTGP